MHPFICTVMSLISLFSMFMSFCVIFFSNLGGEGALWVISNKSIKEKIGLNAVQMLPYSLGERKHAACI